MLAHRAVVIIDLVMSAVGEAVGIMVTGLDALFAVYAFLLIPNKTALQGMDFMSCSVRDTAHRDILTCAAEAAGAVSLDMGKIDEKIRIVYEPRDIDMLEFLEIDFLCIIIFAEIAAVVEHGTSERRFRIAAAFGDGGGRHSGR